jgi:hypothetical protein
MGGGGDLLWGQREKWRGAGMRRRFAAGGKKRVGFPFGPCFAVLIDEDMAANCGFVLVGFAG